MHPMIYLNKSILLYPLLLCPLAYASILTSQSCSVCTRLCIHLSKSICYPQRLYIYLLIKIILISSQQVPQLLCMLISWHQAPSCQSKYRSQSCFLFMFIFSQQVPQPRLHFAHLFTARTEAQAAFWSSFHSTYWSPGCILIIFSQHVLKPKLHSPFVAWWYVYVMYVCIHVFVCVNLYVRMYVCIYVYVYIYIYIYICCACITYIPIRAVTHTHTHTHACTQTWQGYRGSRLKERQ